MSTIKFQVTAGDLLAKYKQRLKGRQSIYLCHTIAAMHKKNCFIDSADVIEQFMLAKPERFLKDRYLYKGDTILPYFLQKYRCAKQPRLALLQAIPPEHVFTFTLVE